jgi:uncharacterized protein YndB with AHSA1/START domain
MAAFNDRIEQRAILRAPVDRVWRALTDTTKFCEWFGAELKGRFEPGARIDASNYFEGYGDRNWAFLVDRVEPMRLLSWRWHPFPVRRDVDYEAETPTLVVFELAHDPNGTLVTVTETGFESLPADRREEAYEAHVGGWADQLNSLDRFVRSKAA